MEFEIIPVIDLLGGQVVRGIRGERENYRPVIPFSCSSSDPLEVAIAYRTLFNFTNIYIADLDRITGKGDNLPAVKKIKALFPGPGQVYCDPGIAGKDELEKLALYLDNLVLGTETMTSLRLIKDSMDVFGVDKVTVSLDIKGGKTVSRAKELNNTDSVSAVKELASTGVERVFVIVLDAVGSFSGVNGAIQDRLLSSGVKILLGGGIKNIGDIYRLKKAGFSGCLVASSLYSGSITPDEIRMLL